MRRPATRSAPSTLLASAAPSPVFLAANFPVPRSAALAHTPLFPMRWFCTSCGPRLGAAHPLGRGLVLRSSGPRLGFMPPKGHALGSAYRRSSPLLSIVGCWRPGGPRFGNAAYREGSGLKTAYRWNHDLVLFPGPAAKNGYVPAPAQGGRPGAATGSDEVTVTVTGASLHRCKAEG